jgi:hypothetical protein
VEFEAITEGDIFQKVKVSGPQTEISQKDIPNEIADTDIPKYHI